MILPNNHPTRSQCIRYHQQPSTSHVVIFTPFPIYDCKKRQSLWHPVNFTSWAVELRQEDNTSLEGVNEANNDVDVMYLDDTYHHGYT
ncbi:hypothetical protein HOLleu_05572 [Holothuria leucospilota]|uniref:Uncharacterized protein n=1 Tax=Holothuria leucospilota TaxID=206669 RepID=A0A9Q1HJ18_HOLLE|nr:hypothetical protein HOLleu_05572 [Holothuria leucospilota]